MAMGTASVWSETTLKERKVGDAILLEVASPQYGLVIDPVSVTGGLGKKPRRQLT